MIVLGKLKLTRVLIPQDRNSTHRRLVVVRSGSSIPNTNRTAKIYLPNQFKKKARVQAVTQLIFVGLLPYYSPTLNIKFSFNTDRQLSIVINKA